MMMLAIGIFYIQINSVTYQVHARNSGNHVDCIVGKDEGNGRIGCWETHVLEESGSIVENDIDTSPLLEELESS